MVFGERTKDIPEGTGPIGLSLPTFADLRQRSRTMDQWAVIQPTRVSLRGAEGSEPLMANRVSTDYFDLVGAQATLGRTFLPEEGVEGARPVVMISEDLREDRWGEEQPLGQVLVLNSEPHEIVGVLPSDFIFLQSNVDVVLPLTRSPQSAPRDSRWYLALARLRRGSTMEQVRAEIRQIALDLEAEYPETLRNRTLDAYNVRYDIPSRQTRLLFGILSLLASFRQRGRPPWMSGLWPSPWPLPSVPTSCSG